MLVHRCVLTGQRDSPGSLQPEGQNVLEQVTEAPAVSAAASGASEATLAGVCWCGGLP